MSNKIVIFCFIVGCLYRKGPDLIEMYRSRLEVLLIFGLSLSACSLLFSFGLFSFPFLRTTVWFSSGRLWVYHVWYFYREKSYEEFHHKLICQSMNAQHETGGHYYTWEKRDQVQIYVAISILFLRNHLVFGLSVSNMHTLFTML